MLAAGTAAQAAYVAAGVTVPVVAPLVRDRYGISLEAVSIAIAAPWLGAVATMVVWGFAADRIGERGVLAAGLSACGLLVAAASFAPQFAVFAMLLGLAGAAGASVNSASGRAVMLWFGAAERGLAFGVRQAAVPIGGLFAAATLPRVASAAGVEAAFVVVGGLCLAGGVAAALVLRDVESDHRPPPPWSVRDRRLWRLSLASGGYQVTQTAILAFVVLFLHDERGLTIGAAAAVAAGVHVSAIVLRIGAGWWSDAVAARIVPLRRLGIAIAVAVAATSLLLPAPVAVVVGAFLVAGGLSMAWNGLAFAAAAELAGRARAGSAVAVQQTVTALSGAIVPPAFAGVVAAASWRLAFALAALGPLAGWWSLRPLAERRRMSRSRKGLEVP